MAGMIGYTGGTTGRPKGALRRSFDPERVEGYVEAYDLADPAHVHLVAGPLYHSAPGFSRSSPSCAGNGRRDAEVRRRGGAAADQRYRCTTTFMAPTLLKRIVDLPDEVRARYDVSAMQVIVVAAAPCPMSIKEQVLALLRAVLYELYGSTELASIRSSGPRTCCASRAPAAGRRRAWRSRSSTTTASRCRPAAGRAVRAAARGTLDEYYKSPDATQQMARGEWLSVGDVAYLDDEGFVYICDRKIDMIISGGVNIYPAEIEDALHRHPGRGGRGRLRGAQRGVGERVHAAIQLQAGASATADELVAFARQHLADYKVPREISFHAELPRDADGKLLKRLLREPYWAFRAARNLTATVTIVTVTMASRGMLGHRYSTPRRVLEMALLSGSAVRIPNGRSGLPRR